MTNVGSIVVVFIIIIIEFDVCHMTSAGKKKQTPILVLMFFHGANV